MLLATALANAYDHHKQVQRCRIVLDSGSQLSFITTSFVSKLGLKIVQRCLPVEGIGSTILFTRGYVFVQLQSTHSDSSVVKMELHILDTISSPLPPTSIEQQQWNHLSELQLADPTFHCTGPVDILLGADTWGMIVRDGVVSRAPTEPCAINTCFGWVVFGRTSQPQTGATHRSHLAVSPGVEPLEAMLKKFWEVDEPPVLCPNPDEICEQIFTSTVSRQADGRYSVQIPFKPNSPVLGDSYAVAKLQFGRLERRLANNEDLRQK